MDFNYLAVQSRYLEGRFDGRAAVLRPRRRSINTAEEGEEEDGKGGEEEVTTCLSTGACDRESDRWSTPGTQRRGKKGRIMQRNLLVVLLTALMMLSTVRAFAPRSTVRSISSTSSLKMGFFDGIFGKKKTASASHILIKGADAVKKCETMKVKLSKSKALATDFATLASQVSACPSSRKGGSLGSFSQGQMVPAFDRIVFSEAVGVVHGPVETPFGAHLILIDSRSD